MSVAEELKEEERARKIVLEVVKNAWNGYKIDRVYQYAEKRGISNIMARAAFWDLVNRSEIVLTWSRKAVTLERMILSLLKRSKTRYQPDTLTKKLEKLAPVNKKGVKKAVFNLLEQNLVTIDLDWKLKLNMEKQENK